MFWSLEALTLGALVCSRVCLAAPGLHTGTTVGDQRNKGRTLQGRFLHITDFHPDPYYKTYSSTAQDAACHRKRGPAGLYGAETSACDSSLSLVNATMAWIKDNLADKVDFVIWTGDSARHDNDEKIPRTQKQVVDQNAFMVQKFAEVWGKGEDRDGRSTNDFKIPIVPTFGNNDILPHNILLPGPNKWTVRYLDLWRGLIPEAQRHQFQQGGWFYVEVIPGKLAVISLNTMYFFSSNSGVDGCANKHEPGYEQFEWLRIQLQIMRDRGMSAMLIGHVPPARTSSKESWEETCWQKYALWERQYRDVIAGSFFGHMNIDHFMLQDFKQIKKSTKKGAMAVTGRADSRENGISLLEDGEVTVASASDYLLDLRQKWSKLPSPPSKKNTKPSADDVDSYEEDEEDELSWWQRFGSTFSRSKKGGKGSKKPKRGKTYLDKIGGKYAERYSVSLVSPSVVPNYFPTLRIIEYNVTGLEHTSVVPVRNELRLLDHPFAQQPLNGENFADDENYKSEVEMAVKRNQKKKGRRSQKKKRKYKFKVPKGPGKTASPGPAYAPQPLTLLGYTQYFANLTHINNDFVAESPNANAPHTIFGLEVSKDGAIQANGWKEGKHGKHQGKKPRPNPHPKKFKFEVEYDTKTDKRYKLKDLTVRRWVELARRIGRDAKKSSILNDDEVEEVEGNDDWSEDEDMTSEDEEVEEDKEIDETRKNGKNGKKHKNNTWFTFVQRAFVGTMNAREIGEVFGTRLEKVTEQEEVMEL